MLRVSSSNVLVVPPFECAWLSLSDYRLDGSACLSFEVKGETASLPAPSALLAVDFVSPPLQTVGDNDVTVIFKPIAGAKRWQPLQRQDGGGGAAAGGLPWEQAAVERNYTVILGSHCNSRLKFEKNGETRELVEGVGGARVDPASFMRYWVNFCSTGVIWVGRGEPGSGLAHCWADPDGVPITGIQHVGLSCWDKHVSYRNVQLLPPLEHETLQQRQQQLQAAPQHQHQHQHQNQQSQQPHQQPAHSGGGAAPQPSAPAAPSLLQLASAALVSALEPASACQVLCVAEILLPACVELYRACVERLAVMFDDVLALRPCPLVGLSADAMADVLQHPQLAVPERRVFAGVCQWAGYPGQDAARDADACMMDAEAEAAAAVAAAQSDPPEAAVASALLSGLLPLQLPEQALHERCPLVADAVAAVSLCGRAVGAATCSAAADKGGHHDVTEDIRTAAEVARVVDLVRFLLMSPQELQAVLRHPLSQRHPVVHQLIQRDQAFLKAFSGTGSSGGSSCSAAEQACSGGDGSSSGGGGRSSSSGGGAAGSRGVYCLENGRHVKPTALQALSRLQRRVGPSCRELMYVCDGDRNGVLHYAGTEHGTRGWTNPVLAGRVEVKASSPAGRYTDPKAVVSGQFLRTSFAGPRYEGGAPHTWWRVDLGPGRRLLCNYYTLRHDGSTDFARDWVLQGSNDLRTWTDLRTHFRDSTLRLPSQYASWPVVGPSAAMPFRAFRLLLTGPTLSLTSPWNLCLSYLELYGYLYLSQEGGGDEGMRSSGGGSGGGSGGAGSGGGG